MTGRHRSRFWRIRPLVAVPAAAAVLLACVAYAVLHGMAVGQAQAFERAPTVQVCYSPDGRTP